jgi:hypothetical protein
MKAKASLGMFVTVVALAGIGGCATPSAQSSSEDRALCQQAIAQARSGDQAWPATLGRMKSLIEVQRCQDRINQFVFGSMNGG